MLQLQANNKLKEKFFLRWFNHNRSYIRRCLESLSVDGQDTDNGQD